MNKQNLLNPVVVWNFRTPEGNFPTNLRCSQCNGSSEVFVEIIRGGPLLRLCKGCLTDYIGMVDNAYQQEMSNKRED